MDTLKQWVMVLLCTGFICSAVSKVKEAPGLKLVCSLTMVLCMLWPVGRLRGLSFALPDLGEYEKQIEERGDEYMQQVFKDSDALISESAGEYISEQAALMGIECEAEVQCKRVEGGLSVPCSAVIYSAQKENAALMEKIETDLGIKKEALCWKEKTYAQE